MVPTVIARNPLWLDVCFWANKGVDYHRPTIAILVEVNSLCTTLNVDESDCCEIIVRLKERELFLQVVLEQDPLGA